MKILILTLLTFTSFAQLKEKSFVGHREKNDSGNTGVTLDWQITKSIDYTEVYKSRDGKAFELVGSAFYIESPLFDTSNFWVDEFEKGYDYYQLRLFNLDGKFTYSPIIFIGKLNIVDYKRIKVIDQNMIFRIVDVPVYK